MAAQYDVNLEKRALLKCLCGSAFAAGQAPVLTNTELDRFVNNIWEK